MATVRIRRGSAADAPLLLALFDEARAAGAAVLRVDCWAGAPPLVAWYERQGFERTDTFDVDGWIGQVFTIGL